MTEGDAEKQAAPESGMGPVNPNAMEPAALARVLGLAEATVRQHIERGAPVAKDGTINLVHYAAWLNQQVKQRDNGTA